MIKYASTFLSHSSAQRLLVNAVREALVRRGVLAWMDVEELTAGAQLSTELARASDAQLTTTAFLSSESLASAWCRDELEPRLRRAPGGDDDIVPVFLEPRMALVKKWELIARWLTPDQTRVDKRGIDAVGLDPDAPDPQVIGMIAMEVARSLFKRVGIRDAARVVIVLDQRGRGARVGRPDEGLIPPNWATRDWPALVFRPDAASRTEHEVLHGDTWLGVRNALVSAFGEAVGTHAGREFYISGNAQLALAWLIGTQVDRSTRARLLIRNPRTSSQLEIDQGDPRFRLPMPRLPESDVVWKTPDRGEPTVSIAMMAATYLPDVESFRSARRDASPLAFRETGYIEGLQDVEVLAQWLATAAKGRHVSLYLGLPFQAVVAVAALSKHAIGNVTFFELDLDARTYRVCRMS